MINRIQEEKNPILYQYIMMKAYPIEDNEVYY